MSMIYQFMYRQILISYIKDFNHELQKIHICAFSKKHIRTSHPEMLFNNNPIQEGSSQKHVGMILDSKLNFEDYLEIIFTK